MGRKTQVKGGMTGGGEEEKEGVSTGKIVEVLIIGALAWSPGVTLIVSGLLELISGIND